MAIRLEKAIIRGEVTNTQRGRVTGRIWLLGRAEPVELSLGGNCLRDLAGCTLKFENPEPGEELPAALVSPDQTGLVGDMTASRKVRVPDVSDEELVKLLESRQPVPSRVSNCLHLEWFSETNGRMVVESTGFNLEISIPEWSMSAREDSMQSRESQANFHAYLDSITGGPDMEDDDDEDEVEDDEDEFDGDEEEETDDDFGNRSGNHPSGADESDDLETALAGGDMEMESSSDDDDEEDEEPLNEFEWEQELREADRRAEAYQEAFDRYRDNPQRERLIAEAMGWEPEEVEEFRDDWQDVTESLQPHNPDDLIESATLLAEDEEGAHHPLSHRAMDFALRLQRDAKTRGLLEGDIARESPVLSVIVSIIALGGKLAAALDGTMHGYDPEPGFVIAMLKRAQVPLNEAMHALSSIQMAGLSKETRNWLTAARSELFELRKDILDLMSDLRK